MKTAIRFFGIITIVVITGFSFTSCSDMSDIDSNIEDPSTIFDSDPPVLTNINDLERYLSTKPDNTAASPYTIVLNIDDLGINNNVTSDVGKAIQDSGKYITLDLSGSSIVEIGNYAFYNCKNLISVTIPNNVTNIGEWAFGYCQNLTRITLFDNITAIEEYAFFGCHSLTRITIPDSVFNIGKQAFAYCESLISITIPKSITAIGEYTFRDCDSLHSINVDSANAIYSSDQGVLYNKDKSTLIQYPNGKYGMFTIPESVSIIGDLAFYSCSKLTRVTIPNSVTTIGYMAFGYCEGLTSVIIPNSVITIEMNAFSFCPNLTVVKIGSGVTNIEVLSFQNCGNLIAIDVDSANTTYSSEQGILYNKNKTVLIVYPYGKTDSSFIVPNSVKTIENFAFFGSVAVWSLTNIIIPGSVISIGESAFYKGYNLLSVTFEGTIEKDNFMTGSSVWPTFIGDLRDKFYETDSSYGTPGTYTREINGTVWTRQ